MMPTGWQAYENREANKSSIYSYEQEEMQLKKEFVEQIKANEHAWTYFESLPPGYKRLTIHFVMSAKREATQLKRLQILIESSEQGLKIPMLRRK